MVTLWLQKNEEHILNMPQNIIFDTRYLIKPNIFECTHTYEFSFIISLMIPNNSLTKLHLCIIGLDMIKCSTNVVFIHPNYLELPK